MFVQLRFLLFVWGAEVHRYFLRWPIAPWADKARKIPDVFCPVCEMQQKPLPKHNGLHFYVQVQRYRFPANSTLVPARRGDTTYRKNCLGRPTRRFRSSTDQPPYCARQQCGQNWPPNIPDTKPSDFFLCFPFALGWTLLVDLRLSLWRSSNTAHHIRWNFSGRVNSNTQRNVKQSLYRPRQTLRPPGVWGFQDFKTVGT